MLLGGSDVSKIRAEVRAVILEDGSAAGEPAWLNVLLVRRLRLYDRLLSVHNFLRIQVDTGLSRDAIIDSLRASKAKADAQLPDDDIRILDDGTFDAAIDTLDSHTNREIDTDVVIKRFLKLLEEEAIKLERSKPALETLRDLPAVVPAPLSESRNRVRAYPFLPE